MEQPISLSSLDSLDRKLLFELDTNSRQPYSAIARKLRTNKENVKYRINRLMNTGLIQSLYTFSDLPTMGFHYFKVYVRLNGGTQSQNEDFFNSLKENETIVYLAHCTGRFDAAFNVVVKDHRAFNQFWHTLQEKFGSRMAYSEVIQNTMQIRCPRGYLVGKPSPAQESNPQLNQTDYTNKAH